MGDDVLLKVNSIERSMRYEWHHPHKLDSSNTHGNMVGEIVLFMLMMKDEWEKEFGKWSAW